MLDVNFWQQRYESQETSWDLGEASPHFQEYMENEGKSLPKGTMAVLGCGRGHDAALFAKAGFDVTGFDYAPAAISEATRCYGNLINQGILRFEQADIFNMDAKWHGKFDYVLEHTCFCAITPERRQDYVNTLNKLLKPNGHYIGVFWEHKDPDGPPYSTTTSDLRRVLQGEFEEELCQPKEPVAPRSGIERFCIFRKK